MNRQQIAHIWANNPTAEKKAGNIFCRDGIIYSYGTHFPIARHVTNGRGVRAVLLTLKSYSSSTASHVSAVWRACSHLLVFRITEVPTGRTPGAEEWRTTFADYKARIADLVAESKAPRIRQATRESKLEAAQKLAAEANEFAAFFRLRGRIGLEDLDKLAAKIAKENEKASKAERERRAELELERSIFEAEKRDAGRDYVAAWIARRTQEPGALALAGKFGASSLLRLSPPVLRLGEDGVTVHTSHGAEVPLEHVRKAVRFVALVRARGEAWQANGHAVRVGHFALSRIEPNGDTRAGCHCFEWAEIERFALSQGWTEIAHAEALAGPIEAEALTPSAAYSAPLG